MVAVKPHYGKGVLKVAAVKRTTGTLFKPFIAASLGTQLGVAGRTSDTLQTWMRRSVPSFTLR